MAGLAPSSAEIWVVVIQCHRVHFLPLQAGTIVNGGPTGFYTGNESIPTVFTPSSTSNPTDMILYLSYHILVIVRRGVVDVVGSEALAVASKRGLQQQINFLSDSSLHPFLSLLDFISLPTCVVNVIENCSFCHFSTDLSITFPLMQSEVKLF